MQRLSFPLAVAVLGCSGSGAQPFDAGVDPDGQILILPDAGSDAADATVDAPIFTPGDPTITPGAPDRILLVGTYVTPDAAVDGQVLVESGVITCAEAGATCSGQPGAAGATIIQTNGVLAPGLIDTHNHILFDIFDDSDWLPAKQYTNHNQWTAEARYGAMVDVKQCLANDSAKPAWCAMTPYGSSAGSLRCELDKWGELKGMIAGTTSIVGLPGTSQACFDSLSRSIDVLQNGGLGDKVQTSALFPPSNPNGVCSNFASMTTDAFLVHVSEGTDQTAKDEFTKLGTITTTPGCLYAPETAITHGTALGATEFAQMASAGMKLTWSPASNVALYGQTTDVIAARAAGVTVSLGPDWSMGGSQNLLDELRFADAWDNAHWGDKLGAKDLVLMATSNAAAVLGFQDKLGAIAKGYLADLFVVSGDPAKPWDAIVGATPKSVAMVMVGGKVLYGDVSIQSAGPATPGCETIDICTKQKFLCVATADTTSKFNQTYADIKAALEQALTVSDMATPDGFDFAPLTPIVKCP